MYKRIDHVALHVSDVERSTAFYERHFGFRAYARHVTPDGIPIAYLALGDTVLELIAAGDGPPGGFHFCLESADFDGAVRTLQGDGVPLLQAPHPTKPRSPREEGWRRVVFAGPDGEQIEIRG